MTRITRIALLLLTASVLSGCDSGSKWKSGKYEVYWIDIPSDLTLGMDLGDGTAIGRVMPQVIAVGEDSKWIVAARHPQGDKSITEYYYFSKDADHPHKNADEIVQGPFTETQFKQKTSDHGLPPLTKHF